MKTWLSRYWKWLPQLLVAGVILYFLLRGVDWRTVGDTFRRLPLWLFPIAMATQLLSQFFSAVRWRWLANQPGIRFREYFGAVAMGGVLGLISPSLLLSDGVNAWWFGRRRGMALNSVSAMLAGRLAGFAVLLAIMLATLPFHLPLLRRGVVMLPRHPATPILLTITAILVCALAGWRLRVKLREIIDKALPALFRPGVAAPVLLVTMGIQICQASIAYVGLHAMMVPVSLVNILFLNPLVLFLSLIPLSPGQIGVREGLNVFFLTQLPGVSREMVLAGVGYGYVLLLLMSTVNSVIAYFLLRRKPLILEPK